MVDDDLFSCAEEYDALLKRGISLSGENKDYFIAGRVSHLRSHLPAGWEPRAIVDFGCGTGETSTVLAAAFPNARVVGVDTAENAIRLARSRHASERVSFLPVAALRENDAFDLCYINGVFHHIKPGDRRAAIALIRRCLGPASFMALFENNPWNPGARLVMARIPFDRDAVPLSKIEAARLMREGGFVLCSTHFLFYFPHALRFLRFLERPLSRLPLGAQYCVVGRKSV
jgi:SAM-dependent methyltransferase